MKTLYISQTHNILILPSAKVGRSFINEYPVPTETGYTHVDSLSETFLLYIQRYTSAIQARTAVIRRLKRSSNREHTVCENVLVWLGKQNRLDIQEASRRAPVARDWEKWLLCSGMEAHLRSNGIRAP